MSTLACTTVDFVRQFASRMSIQPLRDLDITPLLAEPTVIRRYRQQADL